MHLKTSTLAILFCFLFCNIIKAQLTVQLEPSIIDFSKDCLEIEQGSQIEFKLTSSCGGTTTITLGRGAQVVYSNDNRDFTYAFTQLGEFTLFCNLSSEAYGTTTICINVVEAKSTLLPSEIPTINEWGIILIILILLIVSSLSLRHDSLFSKMK